MEPGSEEWQRWRMCGRKVRHAEKPAFSTRLEAYPCPHCQGWHKTTRKRPVIVKEKTAQRRVLRGGFWVEKS